MQSVRAAALICGAARAWVLKHDSNERVLGMSVDCHKSLKILLGLDLAERLAAAG